MHNQRQFFLPLYIHLYYVHYSHRTDHCNTLEIQNLKYRAFYTFLDHLSSISSNNSIEKYLIQSYFQTLVFFFKLTT